MKKNEPNCTLQHHGNTKSAQTEKRCSNPYKRLSLSAPTPDLKERAKLAYMALCALLIVTVNGFSSMVYAQQGVLGGCSMTNVPLINSTPFSAEQFDVAPSNSVPLTSGWIGSNTNLTNGNLTDYITGYAIAVGSASVTIEDNNNNVYNAGNFVGFMVEPVALTVVPSVLEIPLNLGILSDITIETLNAAGIPVESRTGTSLLQLSLSGNQREIGFYTNLPYSSLRLSFSGVLAATRVYYAFMRGTGSCTSPALTCNTPTLLSFPTHPVVAENSTSAVLAIGGIADLDNMVDGSTATAATMVPVAGALGSHGVSVKNTTGQYPIGTYIGFDIENLSIVSADLLSRYSIELYNDDGSLLQTIYGTDALAGINAINSTRRMFGGVSTVAFDEARLVFNSTGLANVNLGATNIYGVYATNLCGNTLNCDQTYLLANPGFPVIINSQRTGFAGVASVNGEVENPEFVIDNIPGNYGTIEIDAGALNTGSISVLDTKNEYPAGTYVGFNLAKGTSGGLLDFIADGNILGTITIETWNNGGALPVESKTISDGLINLSALNGLVAIGSGTNFTSVGFQATQPFDEVVIRISSLAGVANQLRVFGAFAVTTSIPGICTSLPVDFGGISAEFKNGSLFVSWKTLSETNNKEFFIEGSKDGKNWITIGTVASKAADGNSDVTLEYNFTKSLSGLALSGLGLIALLSMPFFRNRFIKACLALTFLVLLGLSCNKDNEQVNTDDMENLYIRIGQVDKDGTVKYSSAVKTVNRQ
ncbi:hypothetical protein [Niabella aquatica]